MIAYGLGSVNDNITSQFQFACALALRNELNINASLEIFDPAMGKEDAGIASELGCEVIPHNEEAKRVVLRKTLFFMPHCNFSLYNGLMWSNWGEHMKNLVVVGNSFNQFSRIMTPEMNKNPTNAIYPLLPFIQETPLEMDMCKDGVTPIPDVQDAFGGLSVDMFTEEGYARAEKSGLWTRRPKEVVMGEVVDTGHNEEVDKYIEELKDNEEHEKELKEIHEEIVRTSSSDEESQAASGKESDNDSDSDSDSDSDDMFEHMYDGWGAQVANVLKPDRFTPEWSVDESTVNAYTLGEKDPRQRIYVYNDEGVSQASKQMCVHTFRCFSDPAKYIVDTIEADDVVNKVRFLLRRERQDWEDNATMLVFPGGADKLYRVVVPPGCDCSGSCRWRWATAATDASVPSSRTAASTWASALAATTERARWSSTSMDRWR